LHMKTHQEVYLKSKVLIGEKVVELLQEFTLEMSGWSFMNRQSQQYERNIGFPSCLIQLDDGYTNPVFAITYHQNGTYYIANITPTKAREISMQEWNVFSMKFVKDLRSFICNNKISLLVTISKDNIGLEAIIPSPKVRCFFERFLKVSPTSHHPSDIERLDMFICAASRYCRREIDLDLLKQYLIEDLNWTPRDASWCRNRIQIGLDILKMNRKFY